LQKRLDKARTQAEKAHRQSRWNSKRYQKFWESTKQYRAQAYARLNHPAQELDLQGVRDWQRRQIIKEEQQAIDMVSASVGSKSIAA